MQILNQHLIEMDTTIKEQIPIISASEIKKGYRGTTDDELQALLREMKEKSPKNIVFIDELEW
jgi:ATP-dependent Clp protease ATP-binding subunit ClpA